MATTVIKYEEHTLDVYYDYQPEEPQVLYYRDGSGYPGCPEELDFSVTSREEPDKGFDKYDMEKIEELIYNKIHEDREPDYPEDDWNNER